MNKNAKPIATLSSKIIVSWVSVFGLKMGNKDNRRKIRDHLHLLPNLPNQEKHIAPRWRASDLGLARSEDFFVHKKNLPRRYNEETTVL